jgi:hypothetical protein
MSERVGDSLGDPEDGDRDAFDFVRLDAILKKPGGESDNAEGRIADLGLPILETNRDPDAARHLIGNAVEGEGGDKADDAPWDSLGCFSEGVVRFHGGIRELVEAAAEPRHNALLFETGHGRSCDAGPSNLGEARDSVLPQKVLEALSLGSNGYVSSD